MKKLIKENFLFFIVFFVLIAQIPIRFFTNLGVTYPGIWGPVFDVTPLKNENQMTLRFSQYKIREKVPDLNFKIDSKDGESKIYSSALLFDKYPKSYSWILVWGIQNIKNPDTEIINWVQSCLFKNKKVPNNIKKISLVGSNQVLWSYNL